MTDKVLLQGQKLYWMLGAFAVSLLPHLVALPGSIALLVGAMLLYRLMIQWGKVPFPGKVLKAVMVLMSAALFFLEYRYLYTIETAVSFFVIFTALKLIEVRFERDCYLLICLLIYLNATKFLFEQGILWTMGQSGAILICLFALLQLNVASTSGGAFRGIAQFFRLMLICVPLVLVVFVFFPRFGPLWQFNLDTGKPQTGITDAFSPGDIAELSQSSARAFRVAFSAGSLPDRSQWYWRGLIFDEFDGRLWRQSWHLGSTALRLDGSQMPSLDGLPFYTVMIEPTQQRWGFALANSYATSADPSVSRDGLIRFQNPLDQPRQYRLFWQPEVPEVRASPHNVSDLQLPPRGGEMARQWAQERVARGIKGMDYIKDVMAFFASESFFYTLRPPRMPRDVIDEFLFEQQRGFCSHYAGGMVFLLRAAGIPARLVGGYQGGEPSADGSYLIVHQYDAHAWVEAWLPETGWRRYDPTAEVAPSRILDGLERAVQSEGSFLENTLFAARKFDGFAAVRWLRLTLDEINYGWQRWVVGYNSETQTDLLKDYLGEVSAKNLAFAMLVLGGGMVAGMILAALWLGRQGKTLSPSLRLFLRLERQLAKRGLGREPGETLRAFVGRAAAAYPGASEALTQFLKRLEFVHYAAVKDRPLREKQEMPALRKQVREVLRSIAAERP